MEMIVLSFMLGIVAAIVPVWIVVAINSKDEKESEMTREEAIKELQESLDTLREYDIAHSSRLKQALEMALKALEELPKRRKEVKKWKRKVLMMGSKADAITRHSYSYGKMDAIKEIIAEVENMDTLITRSEVLEVIDRVVEGSK